MDWSKYNAEQVRTKSVGGVRLALLFAQDYEKKFNQSVCISCSSNFAADFKKYVMSDLPKQEALYRLKPMYDGISLGFNKGRVFNVTITEKQAIELAKNHPKGKGLFDIFTEKKVDLTENVETVEVPKAKRVKKTAKKV